ncbi:hypothetical protein [Salinigranum sp. GCM10025319]|uniref:hypothetical protein n=1 Tax=Salinigranum sp. GCM10025319 TaxID=3252687 RepID=UPI0036241C5E
MDVPEDAPNVCPVCGTAYDSVSRHDAGLMVNLLDNVRYRRVCFEPVSSEGVAQVRFYHHTHEQVGESARDPELGPASERVNDAVEGVERDDPVSTE